MAGTPERFARELRERVEDRPHPKRKLVLVGLLAKHLPEGARAVLVGGSVVEFYTSGGYTTADVDLVGDTAPIAEFLTAAGFEQDGRFFTNTTLELLVEVPGTFLRDTEEVEDVRFEDLTVPMVRLEDLLVDRLLAARFWESTTDWEQAVLVASAHRHRLDLEALREKARANDVEDTLAELLEVVEGPR